MGRNLGSSRPTYPPLPFPGGRTEPREAAPCFVSPGERGQGAAHTLRGLPGFAPVLGSDPRRQCCSYVGSGSPGVAFAALGSLDSDQAPQILGGPERVPALCLALRVPASCPGGRDGGGAPCVAVGEAGTWVILSLLWGSIWELPPAPFLDWYVGRPEAAERARAWAVG